MKFLTALTFTFGILIMGSDGAWFPWINILGAGIFSLSVPLAYRIR